MRAKRATCTFWVDKSSVKMPKRSILTSFENLKLAVKQCYQTGQKLLESAKIEKFKWDILSNFRTLCKRSIFTFPFPKWKCELSFQFLTFLTDWNVKALSSQELKTRKIGKVWSSNPHLILIISINVVWLRNSTFLHRHHGMKMALFHLKLSLPSILVCKHNH